MTANLKTLLRPVKKRIIQTAELKGGLFLRGSGTPVGPDDQDGELMELLSDPERLDIGAENFQRRRAKGARCFGLYYEECLVASGWVSGPGCRVTILHDMTLTVPPDAIYIWDCRTMPEVRRRGHFQRLLRQISRWHAPSTRVLVAVDWRNRASRAALEKTGFQTVFTYWGLRLFGHSAAGIAVESYRLMNAQKVFDRV